GHDWGAVVGWLLAGRHPARVAGLTALSVPHPAAVRDALAVSTQALRSAYVAFFQLPLLPESVLLTSGAAPLRRLLRGSGLPQEAADRYVDRMREPGALRAALNWYRALPLEPPTPGRVRVPTVSVRGAREPAMVKQAALLTSRYVRGAYRHAELPGAGHWLPETRAGDIAPLVLELVTGDGPSSQGQTS
ncbi:MAG: alpha/beta hydrolase, partial [Actinomycetota bacterium]|nr:alpha/beta hydrolase [Actinomycetota bacterium]